MRHSRNPILLYVHKNRAFTLVEVLLALSITAIGLIPLLHLLVVSISLVDSARCLSQATLIGNAKLAEFVGKGYPEIGTDSGTVESESSDVIFEWQVSVTDVHDIEIQDIDLSGLRKVAVAVTLNEGQREKQISLSTYVFIDQTVTMTNLEGMSAPPSQDRTQRAAPAGIRR
ncbi:prepilin-type N-terminal cleavage/methylation domain-containing protein [Planctomycetota bacterium]